MIVFWDRGTRRQLNRYMGGSVVWTWIGTAGPDVQALADSGEITVAVNRGLISTGSRVIVSVGIDRHLISKASKR